MRQSHMEPRLNKHKELQESNLFRGLGILSLCRLDKRRNVVISHNCPSKCGKPSRERIRPVRCWCVARTRLLISSSTKRMGALALEIPGKLPPSHAARSTERRMNQGKYISLNAEAKVQTVGLLKSATRSVKGSNPSRKHSLEPDAQRKSSFLKISWQKHLAKLLALTNCLSGFCSFSASASLTSSHHPLGCPAGRPGTEPGGMSGQGCGRELGRYFPLSNWAMYPWYPLVRDLMIWNVHEVLLSNALRGTYAVGFFRDSQEVGCNFERKRFGRP